MTKQKKGQGSASSRLQAGSARNDSSWKGEGVNAAAHGSESAEAAANRAEGNARVPVQEARDSLAASADPAKFGFESAGSADSPDEDESSSHVAAEDHEVEEEKRLAAAEDHAKLPGRHAPHGRL